MNKVRYVIFYLLIFISAICSANESKEGQLLETVLDNGLKVLTVEYHNSPIIYSQLTYKVGSRNEGMGSTGLAHITEHMMFKGTAQYSKGEISKIIKNNAGVFNAFTTNDMTAYFEQMPKNKIDIALAIESDRMYNCLIDSAELKKELEVIKEERRMRTENNAEGIFREEFNAAAYKASPNRWPVIGWMSDIANTNRDDVWNFYRTYYTPNNATLVLVGDFNTNEMLTKVNHYFGAIPKGPQIDDKISVEPEQSSKRTITVKRTDVKTAKIQMAWHTPAIAHADNAALRVLSRVLGGGKTSRLRKRLVEGEKIVSRISARVKFAKDPSLFIISTELKKENIEKIAEIEKLIWSEIIKIKNEGITEYELQKMKNRIEHNEIFENMKISRVGGRLSTYETYYNLEYIDLWKQELKAVAPEDVKRVAREYLSPEKMIIGYLLPADEETSTHSISKEQSENASKYYYQLPSKDKGGMEELDVARPNPIEPKIQQGTLKNGIPLYFIQDELFPIFSIRGLIRTGNCPEESEKPKLSILFSRMMNRGTTKHSYEELNEKMDFFPFGFDVSGGNEYIRFSGGTRSELADTVLAYGYKILTQPAFPEDGFKIIRDQIIATHRKANAGAGWKGANYLFKTVYGEKHPYAWSLGAGENEINRIQLQDLKAFHNKYVCPQNAALCVLSNLPMEVVLEKLNRTFGRWQHTNPPELEAFTATKKLEGRTVHVIPMPDKKQADVRIGGTLVPYGHPDTDAIDLAVHILGGSSLTSRLGVSIREEQGLAYGVGIKTRQRETGGLWFLHSATKAENAEKLFSSALLEIDRMRNEEVTDEELLNAKRYFIGTLPMVIETPHDVLGQVFDMVRHELPLNDFDSYPDRVNKITKSDILRVMRTYFNPKDIVMVGTGPLEPEALNTFKK